MNKEMQEAPRSFRGRLYNRDTAKPKGKQILVLKTGLAGMQFHIESEEEKQALDAITPGKELMLFREPENEYDEWAVAVYLTENEKLGYISRYKNETIARLMDAGKKFTAVVDDAEKELEQAEKRRRYAPTENMVLLFSVYLVE